MIFPDAAAVLRPGARIVSQVLRTATIATMPRWMRSLAGLRQSRVVDALVVPRDEGLLPDRPRQHTLRLALLGRFHRELSDRRARLPRHAAARESPEPAEAFEGGGLTMA